MIAIIPANPAPEVQAEPLSPSGIAASARRSPGPISCRGNVLRLHPTPAAMIIALRIDTPQMLRDVESGPLDQAGHEVLCSK
jgi:hypothetical protein